MCGIFGWLQGADPDTATLLRDRLAHRGPDAFGSWSDIDADIWLGHRRLAILDLSEAGAQPMISRTERFVITYNGEVFNHEKLRIELREKGHRFVGHSDTEVILAAIEQWGVESALTRFVGFFAFAVWDRKERSLTLVRDRLGLKPLYYSLHHTGRFAFASELRALESLPWVDRSLDPDALACYFRYLAVSPPATIFRGIRHVPPGHVLKYQGGTISIKPWWSIAETVRRGKADPFKGNIDEAADELEAILFDAVRQRMSADVPVGAFLSGGIDSSLVVAIMRAAGESVKTFTVGFDAITHDESSHAEAVAKHLGTDHIAERISAGDALSQVKHISTLHDEPFADVSSIPTYLLCAAARRHVKVALSGDGGDELFGGYPRYFWADRISKARRLFGPLAPLAARALRALPQTLIDGPIDALTGGRFSGSVGLTQRVHRFARYLGASQKDVYQHVISTWPNPETLLSKDVVAQLSAAIGPNPERFSDLPWSEQMMATDQVSFLPDDILTKVDRMSMAVALETRAPLLDHRVVEFSWRLPVSYKVAQGGDTGKLILRKILDRHLPRRLVERPKMGFGLPLASWLRGPLKNWAEGLLFDSTISASLLNDTTARTTWDEHQAGHDRASMLWTILVFLQWKADWGATV